MLDSRFNELLYDILSILESLLQRRNEERKQRGHILIRKNMENRKKE